MVNDIIGKITNISYTPYLCSDLPEFEFNSIENALNFSAFLLDIDGKNKVAVSTWVSPKRTRSYPYARVYNTLNFSGKRVTIIPVFKDEGLNGDRDFLQFDTVALMSLLNVHVIIAYYTSATKSPRYANKITNQKLDTEYIRLKLLQINSGQQSDALHWNMQELGNILQIGTLAIESYRAIGKILGVKMSDFTLAYKRIAIISASREAFLNSSRANAKKAQGRECSMTHLSESVDGTKGKITIKNYLGGEYYFTVDETELSIDTLKLVEAKHCKNRNKLPAINDIKDALLKMILYTNLCDVHCNEIPVSTFPCLKLTNSNSNFSQLSVPEKRILNLLYKEAEVNHFNVKLL